jgi:hypothetical protein
MTTETTLVLLGFGLGALLIAKTGSTREDPRVTFPRNQLQESAIMAQRTSAIASRRARTLTALWLEQEAHLHDRQGAAPSQTC